jgi:hypothetical protein
MPLQQLALQALLRSLPAGATPRMQPQQRQQVKAAVRCWGCSSKATQHADILSQPFDALTLLYLE